MTTKPNEPEAQKLRDLIAEIAADLSTENPFWTAKLLADALITRGIGIVAVQPVADAGGVTAADREAAVKAARETDYTDVCIARMKQGLYDHFPFVQAFARHRLQSVAAATAAKDAEIMKRLSAARDKMEVASKNEGLGEDQIANIWGVMSGIDAAISIIQQASALSEAREAGE